MILFARHDFDVEQQKLGMFPVANARKARELNSKGFGIHCCVNDFVDRRRDENITKINYWTADLDDGSKEEMLARINDLPLQPTILVETKKGYHCYWKAIDATMDYYKDVQTGLIVRLNADRALKSPARTLRCPNFFHLKDPKNPFMVKTIRKTDNQFTQGQMLFCYGLPRKIVKKVEYKGDKEDMLKEENFEKLYHISQIGEGGRNNDLARICLWLRDEGFTQDVVLNTLQRINGKISRPLPQGEVKSILWGKF